MEATVIGLLISAFVPKVLEYLKFKQWAIFIQPYAPALNRLTAGAIAIATAIGVTAHFDAAAGRLTVDGLFFDQIAYTGLNALLNWGLQELVYRRFINTPTSTPPDARKGGFYLIPIVLALGLSLSSCASLPRAGNALAQAETSIHQAMAFSVSTTQRLCSSHAITTEQCEHLRAALRPAVAEADAFNRAVASNTTANIPTMLLSLNRLVTDLEQLLPTGEDRAAILQHVNAARAWLLSLRGGK